MRLVTLVLIALLAAIQYPLWFGKGGWMYVHDLRDQLAAQQQKNAQLKERNDRLTGEVQDLKDGTSAIEERARFELGMVKDGEVFVQFLAPEGASSTGAPRVVTPAPVVAATPVSAPSRPATGKTADKAGKGTSASHPHHAAKPAHPTH